MVASYLAVRRAVGFTGLLLPLALWPLGWLLFGVGVQDNMSCYYHTPLRDVFVGALCAIGVFLYCYEGHDWIENWTANAGSAAAIGVALLPLDPGSDPLVQQSLVGYLHSLCGGALFLTLAFYSYHHFPSRSKPPGDPADGGPTTDENEEAEPHVAQRDLIYRASGLVILLAMIAMAAYLVLPTRLKEPLNRYNFLFWMEWVALWSFAAAWLTKGRALVADLAVEVIAVPVEMLQNLAKRRD